MTDLVQEAKFEQLIWNTNTVWLVLVVLLFAAVLVHGYIRSRR